MTPTPSREEHWDQCEKEGYPLQRVWHSPTHVKQRDAFRTVGEESIYYTHNLLGREGEKVRYSFSSGKQPWEDGYKLDPYPEWKDKTFLGYIPAHNYQEFLRPDGSQVPPRRAPPGRLGPTGLPTLFSDDGK